VTDLYEAGDINQTDGPSDEIDDDIDDEIEDDIDDDIEDEIEDDIDDDIEDETDEGAEEGNQLTSVDGGAPLTVLTYLARSLSNDPDAVVIDTDERRNGLRLSLHVAPDDMGRVIGRRGRTAQAIRTLVNVAGAKDGVQASVDIVDD
jgi:predicted RNA-binding protein YlqC (UPF0109 family)